MDIVSNSFEKCKSEEEEEEESLKFEIQTDHLTARFKLEKQLHCSEKEEKNNIHPMETNHVKAARGRDLNCSEKQEKNDIGTRKSGDLKNCLEKKSSTTENLIFEIQTDHLTARFKLDKQLYCLEKEEKNDIETIKSVFEMETNLVTARNLNCSEKQEKNDIDTRKSEDLNRLEKKSSGMEKSHSDEEKEEERMKWRIEDDEYVCYVCGLRGNKFLDYFSDGCNQQEVAHRYCAGKGLEDCANLEGVKDMRAESESLEVEGKGMSPLLSELFQELAETETSVIDHFILKKNKQK